METTFEEELGRIGGMVYTNAGGAECFFLYSREKTKCYYITTSALSTSTSKTIRYTSGGSAI